MNALRRIDSMNSLMKRVVRPCCWQRKEIKIKIVSINIFSVAKNVPKFN